MTTVHPNATAATPGPQLLTGAHGLAEQLAHNARTFPGKTAIVHPDGRNADGSVRYRELTYGQLQEQVDVLADAFAGIGIGHGTRTVLMAAPGPDLFVLLFALLRRGAVPVVVDPGMGVRRMLHCYRAVGAEAFVGPPLAHAVRVLGRRTFSGVRVKVTLGRRWGWGGHTLAALRTGGPGGPPAERAEVGGEDLMMIGFTTGSTGPAKGVEYTHRMAAAMAAAVRAAHDRDRGEVSLVTLPLYGVFDLLFGSTLVLAPLAPSKVGRADPGPLVAAMLRYRVSTMFASPALLRRLADHLAAHGTELPDLRCVVSGGAPVPAEVVGTLRRVLDPGAAIHVSYGATEALPITSIESAEILARTAAMGPLGAGTCFGRPGPGTRVRIVEISDGPQPSWYDGLEVPEGTVGEIVVSGGQVSARYHAAPAADAAHKIHEEADGTRWHRTGDLGRLDAEGRLWFAGRRTQRVRTADGDLYTVACEGVFNAHPLVRRTALVGVGAAGAQRPVVCVETDPGLTDRQWLQLTAELRDLGAARPQTAGLDLFLRHPGFPVDVRHNAKIGREQLARWAAGRLDGSGRWRGRALRAVPLAGWAYLAAGLLHPVDQPVLAALWWIDAFLSVVVHAAQIPAALPRGRAAGHGPAATTALTMLYGATWWRRLPAAARPVAPLAPADALEVR
ncbi:fatty acid CoA ligase family protein [Kitasatospora sp. NPDC048540]|uniref:fatty acid CoA ligase family protein n=1 Tax=Kitasatospora sp. NPDC048540 TaxID=3155634 RepID=UPI00340A358E